MLACYLGNGFSLLHHLYHAHVVSGCYATIGNDVEIQTMSLPHLGVRQPEGGKEGEEKEEGEEREGGEEGGAEEGEGAEGTEGGRTERRRRRGKRGRVESGEGGKKREERRERRRSKGGLDCSSTSVHSNHPHPSTYTCGKEIFLC